METPLLTVVLVVSLVVQLGLLLLLLLLLPLLLLLQHRGQMVGVEKILLVQLARDLHSGRVAVHTDIVVAQVAIACQPTGARVDALVLKPVSLLLLPLLPAPRLSRVLQEQMAGVGRTLLVQLARDLLSGHAVVHTGMYHNVPLLHLVPTDK